MVSLKYDDPDSYCSLTLAEVKAAHSFAWRADEGYPLIAPRFRTDT